MESDPSLKQLLVYLFAGTRGAEMRMKIISALAEKPSNVNRLALDLGADYKSIQYQIAVLLKHNLITSPDRESYGALYFLSTSMEKNLSYVREIWERYGKSKINNRCDKRQE